MIVDDFQKQIENNASSFTDDEMGLFKDSIRCFHAAIYRPAYIMAYQAMMVYFRRLIQAAKMPKGFDAIKWKTMQLNLAKDKEWEEEVNNAIRKQANPKATPPEVPILVMTDALRKDFDFWRNRRNDCAHYKEYVINDSHVLAFYSFLSQYLMKISVEGGMNTLLNEFKDACDPTKTSPKASLQPLVDKILSMVNPDEMNDFFDYLEGVMGYRLSERYTCLLADIIKGGNEVLKAYVVNYVRSDKDTMNGLINKYPDLVGHLVERTEVREYWMKHLKKVRNRVAVLARMIMVGLIVKDEIEEAIKKVIDHSYSENEGMGEVSEAELATLNTFGFFNALNEEYFNSNYTSKNAKECGKLKYNFFYGYMAYLPIDKEWVAILAEIFSQVNYPTVWLDILKQNYLNNAEFKAKFEKVASDNAIKLPDCLK